MKTINRTTIKCLGFAAISFVITSCAAPSGNTSGEKRSDIHAMTRQTLGELYSSKPEARSLVANSAGYAVFNQIETKVLTAGSANGYGVAVNKATGKETYMRMAGLSAGFGAGLTNTRTVIVFRKTSTYNKFINSGWSAAADAQAAAAVDRSGVGAGLSINPTADPVVYHMTRSGVAVSASVGAEKVWADKSLNH
jgi:lipid-binding SYLF domain-containing protein